MQLGFQLEGLSLECMLSYMSVKARLKDAPLKLNQAQLCNRTEYCEATKLSLPGGLR